MAKWDQRGPSCLKLGPVSQSPGESGVLADRERQHGRRGRRQTGTLFETFTWREVLGFSQPRFVRRVIKANLEELLMHGPSCQVSTMVEIGSGAQREVAEYYLNEDLSGARKGYVSLALAATSHPPPNGDTLKHRV